MQGKDKYLLHYVTMKQRHFDDLQLGSIELFCAAVELGSFSEAANASGVTPAAVSRSVARLEARMQVRLFVRSTRRIRLTEEGRAYYAHCRQALNLFLEAEAEVTGTQYEPIGVLRISVPTTYGHYRVLPLIPRFRERYPGIRVEVEVSNRSVDFVEEGYDLAIRVRPPTDSSMIARPLEDAPLVFVASPEYLQKNGTPACPDDLLDHECIQFIRPVSGRPVPWQLLIEGEERPVDTHGSIQCSDDILGTITLARSGAGVAQTMRLLVEEDLAAGRLVTVLDPWAGALRRISIVYPHRRFTPLRVRAFADFLLGAV